MLNSFYFTRDSYYQTSTINIHFNPKRQLPFPIQPKNQNPEQLKKRHLEPYPEFISGLIRCSHPEPCPEIISGSIQDSNGAQDQALNDGLRRDSGSSPE